MFPWLGTCSVLAAEVATAILGYRRALRRSLCADGGLRLVAHVARVGHVDKRMIERFDRRPDVLGVADRAFPGKRLEFVTYSLKAGVAHLRGGFRSRRHGGGAPFAPSWPVQAAGARGQRW